MQRLWWLNLVRGAVALLIGLFTLVWPHSTRYFFVNFLALYWLSSGVIGLREYLAIQQKRVLVPHLFGIVVGVLLLFRAVYIQAFSPELALKILGLVALCTGLLHLFWGARKPATGANEQPVHRVYLGMFEVVLGVLLILVDALAPWSKLFIGVWMLLGGILLMLQALQIRKTWIPHSS